MGEMKIVYIPITELKPYEKNPRMNDGSVGALCESIKQYGFKVPIVVDKNNVIVCGHTRWKAAVKLEMDEVPCIVANDLSEKQIKAFRIADNKVSDFSIWDNKLLLEELEDLDDMFTGFELGDMDLSVLDEGENKTIENNEYGVTYEVVCRSEDRSKVEKIKEIWEQMTNETESSDS